MEQKNILITGVSRGIGKAVAEKFLAEDFTVIGTSTSGTSPIDADKFECHKLRLDDRESIKAFASRWAPFGESQESSKPVLDGIINNAAILLEDWSNPEINIDQLRKTMEVNVLGTIEFTESMVPLISAGAHIINVSSGWGTFSESGFDATVPHYKLSKTAINMYTKLLAERLRKSAIRVSAINPGWVRTDMGSQAASRSTAEAATDIFDLFKSPVESGYLWRSGKIQSW